MNYPITILENHKRIMRQMEKELMSKGEYPQEEIDKVNELMSMVDEAIDQLNTHGHLVLSDAGKEKVERYKKAKEESLRKLREDYENGVFDEAIERLKNEEVQGD